MPAASAVPSSRPASSSSDRGVALWILGGLLLVGLLAWAGSSVVGRFLDEGRPAPVWVDIKPVQAQMADGRMVSVKVNLRLGADDSASELDAYKPVIGTLIQASARRYTREALASPAGMQRLAAEIRDSVNDYLDQHGLGSAVHAASFGEFIILPVGEIGR